MKHLYLNLQLFAEDGGGEGGTTPVAGENGELSKVVYGKQTTKAPDSNTDKNKDGQGNAEPEINRAEEFKKLIKGEYKKEFDEHVQSLLDRRFKAHKETETKLSKTAPVMDFLAAKYGLDSGDPDKLLKALQDDNSLFQAEAMEKGISVEQLRYIKKIEADLTTRKRQEAERERIEKANQLYEKWNREAEECKKIYTNFDFKKECENPQFMQLIANANVPVRTAFEVIHKDDIIGGAMAYTAQQVRSNTAKDIAARGQRPTENGTTSQAAAIVKSDPSKFTDSDIDEVIRRVRSGEKISF